MLFFLLLHLIRYIAETFLVILDMNFIKRNSTETPQFIRSRMSDQEYERNIHYNLSRHRFTIVTDTYSLIVILAVILCGILAFTEQSIFRLALPYRLNQILYIAVVSLFFTLIAVPQDLFLHFKIESAYGFNTMTCKTYVLDFIKGILVNAVFMMPLAIVLFWLVERFALWWIWIFCIFSLFQLIIYMIYPVIIAPLFNKYKPLPDGELKERLIDLTGKTGFKIEGIFIMDGSRRSRHSNAYFTGFGAKKRIVLYDTLVEKLSPSEIEAVLAHEIGHYRKKHIVKNIVINFVFVLAGFFILSRLLKWDIFFRAFGFDVNSVHAGIILFAFFSGPVFFIFRPLMSVWSRKFEYEADEYARKILGSGDALISALLELGYDNKSNMTVHPLYSFFYYSHPVLPERIKALSQL